MTKISKRANVAYSANQMFALVNDIKSYPDFLPWCSGTNVLEDNGDSLIASVSISLGKITQTFTTANTIQPDTSINMKLVKGPFKEMNGHWQFHDDANGGCSVSLNMQFEFKNRLLKHTFGTAFKKITDSLVDAFIERARVVYGTE
ncbi:MAG: type II toxin-antitoxin system RatA family toxin [Proteobacteria bacterium]|nr:type II toxin-antitoxin system RatA family toxin [Pseudomonadota bacterium]